MKPLRIAFVTSIVIAFAGGCDDGALEVRNGDRDVGLADDAGHIDTADSENGVEDVGPGDTGTDDANGGNDTSPPPECETGEFECLDDTTFRVCIDDGAGSAEWSEESCSGGELCADAADHIDDICQTCPDDEFAPHNHSSPDAPTLSAGDAFSNLRLCEEPDGQNFFYLEEIDSFDVLLEWDDEADALSMDVWVADDAGVTWEGRDWYSMASENSFQAHASEDLSASRHVYIRVFFRDGAPASGVPYTISRSN